MSPREDRRYRRVRPILPLAGGLMGWISSANGWSIGAIYLSIAVLIAAAVLYVHYEPRDPTRSRR
jgi:hypothetical protein